MTGKQSSATQKAVAQKEAQVKRAALVVDKKTQAAAEAKEQLKTKKKELSLLKKGEVNKADVKKAETTAKTYTVKKCSCGVEFRDENNKDGSTNQLIKNCHTCRDGKKKSK